MANFFYDNPDRGLTRLSLKLGESITIGLYGGGPPPQYVDLDVRSSAPASVSCTEDKTKKKTNQRFFTLKALGGSSADIVGTLTPGGSDYYTASVNIDIGAKVQWGHEKARKAIVDEALKWTSTAHYLWGTAGNTPGLHDGICYGKENAARMFDADCVKQYASQLTTLFGRPVKDALDPDTPIVNTAFSTPDAKIYLCAGGVGDKASQPMASSDVKDFIESQKCTSPTSSNATYTPRRYGTGGAVRGNSCKNAKHFDCVGLVNHSVGMMLKNRKLVPLDIYAWMNAPGNSDGKSTSGTAGMTAIVDGQPAMNGDIVGQFNGQWHHIGLVYMDGSTARIVQAKETIVGLGKDDKYNPGSWQRRVRVHDHLLLDGGVG